VWRMHADAVRATFSELSNNLRILIPNSFCLFFPLNALTG
jgi:hypothetical protein